jgi:hypothetical protein
MPLGNGLFIQKILHSKTYVTTFDAIIQGHVEPISQSIIHQIDNVKCHSSSIKPNTWIGTISNNLMYFESSWLKMVDMTIFCH